MEAEQQYKVSSSQHHRHSHAGRIFGGFIVLIAGVLLLARESGVDLPWWLFTWQMLLITIGLYVGVRASFRGWAWLILIAIGLFFFAGDLIENLQIKRYLWPAVIILVGLFIMFRPRRKHHHHHRYAKNAERETGTTFNSDDDYLDSTTMFGAMKKNIVSKDFKGGEAVTIFGGTELNMLNSDLTTTRSLELTQIFGGTKLIVPADWNILADEVVIILGGVDDKRTINSVAKSQSNKTLRLNGTCIFGGIDIVSY